MDKAPTVGSSWCRSSNVAVIACDAAFCVERSDESLLWHTQTLVDAFERSGLPPRDVIWLRTPRGMYLRSWPSAGQCVEWCSSLPPFRVRASGMRDVFRSDPSMFNPASIGQNPMDEGVALEFVFDLSSGARGLGAIDAGVFLCEACDDEPCPLNSWPAVPASYIVCNDDRTITPAWQHGRA